MLKDPSGFSPMRRAESGSQKRERQLLYLKGISKRSYKERLAAAGKPRRAWKELKCLAPLWGGAAICFTVSAQGERIEKRSFSGAAGNSRNRPTLPRKWVFQTYLLRNRSRTYTSKKKKKGS